MHDAELRLKGLWLVVGWTGVALVVWLSLTASPPSIDVDQSDKFGHFIAYLGLMGWFGQIYRAPASRNRAAVAFVALGAGLEVMQWTGGLRHFELADMAANTAGVIAAWLLSRTAFADLLARLETRLPY